MQQMNGHAHPAVEADTTATNAMTRTGIDGTEIARRDTASLAMAEKQKALVQARIVQAMRFPRDEFQFRERILKSCKRLSFATSATYAKPLGKKKNETTGQWEEQYARGLSVRFAEEAARHFANLAIDEVIIHDDPSKRIVYVTATDLETNYSTSKEVVIEKTIERRKVKDGQTVIATRLNSYGDTVYIIEANEEETAVKAAAQLSKARRNLILQMIPGDIQDEAKAAIEATKVAGEKAVDPTQRRKDLVDRYSTKLGISAAQLASYLGKNLDDATGEEMRELNEIANAIEDKFTTWREVVEARGAADDEGEVTPASSAASAKVLDALKNSKEKRAVQKAGPAPTAPAAPPVPTAQTQQPAPAAAPATGEVRAPTDAPAERRAEEPAGNAVGFGIVRDAIDDAESADDLAAAKAMLDGARKTLSLHQVAKLESALKKAADRLGVKA